MTHIGLISLVFLFMFDTTGFCSAVLVDQAFPLDVFVFALWSCRFLIYFIYFCSRDGVSAPSCKTLVTAEKKRHVRQVCRNLNTPSALLVQSSKALFISSVLLLMIILGSLFRWLSLLLSCCRLSKMEYFTIKVKMLYFCCNLYRNRFSCSQHFRLIKHDLLICILPYSHFCMTFNNCT